MSDTGTTHCIIPGGCTSKLQPLDVSVNKPFKQILRGCWSQFIHESVSEAADKAAKIKTASKQQVLDWVVKAWQVMKEKTELISKSFQVTGITSTDPAVVRRDAVLKKSLEAVQQELDLSEQEAEELDLLQTLNLSTKKYPEVVQSSSTYVPHFVLLHICLTVIDS